MNEGPSHRRVNRENDERAEIAGCKEVIAKNRKSRRYDVTEGGKIGSSFHITLYPIASGRDREAEPKV